MCLARSDSSAALTLQMVSFLTDPINFARNHPTLVPRVHEPTAGQCPRKQITKEGPILKIVNDSEDQGSNVRLRHSPNERHGNQRHHRDRKLTLVD